MTDDNRMMATIVTVDHKSIEELARNPKVPEWCTGVYFLQKGAVVGKGRLSWKRGFELGIFPDDEKARALFDDEATRMGLALVYSMYDGQNLAGSRLTDESEERYKDTTVIGIEIYDIEQQALDRTCRKVADGLDRVLRTNLEKCPHCNEIVDVSELERHDMMHELIGTCK